MSNETSDQKIETLEIECTKNSTLVRWVIGPAIGLFILLSSSAYVKADKASHNLSTEAKIRFAVQEEQYKQIQKELAALHCKVDDLREILNRKEKKDASSTDR